MLRQVRNLLFDLGGVAGLSELPVSDGQRILVVDSSRNIADNRADAREMLADFLWSATTFEAVCRFGAGKAEATVEFDSPLPSGDGLVDRATLDWYPARDAAGRLCSGKAVLALDVLQANNIIAAFVGRSFAKAGMHGFVLHMPHSANRGGGKDYDYADFLPGVRQAMGDARRARDVILALPGVVGPVAIQGTSFGGFIATVAAALDRAFNPVMLALCGGDIFRVLTQGKADSAKLRRRLADAGLARDADLRSVLHRTEPLRLAHRLDPAQTLFYSARRDQVVPAECSRSLIQAASLASARCRLISGCHYTCAINYARPLAEMIKCVRSVPEATLTLR